MRALFGENDADRLHELWVRVVRIRRLEPAEVNSARHMRTVPGELVFARTLRAFQRSFEEPSDRVVYVKRHAGGNGKRVPENNHPACNRRFLERKILGN